MSSQRPKLSTGKRVVFSLIIILAVPLLLELIGALLYPRVLSVDERTARELFLINDHQLSLVQLCGPHPYSLYMPAPDVVARGYKQHNSLGFRGPELRDDEHFFRIFCLGGSTTYSWGVADPALAWPAQLEALLVGSGRAVEVVNAGLPRGTTAEALATLHFRILPHSPRLVILHAGFNDVHPVLIPEYRPDYTLDRSHWVFYESVGDQLLLRSKLMTIVRFRLHDLQPADTLLAANYVTGHHNQWEVYWKENLREAEEDERYLGLRNNLRSMAAICRDHDIELVLAPTTVVASFRDEYPAFDRAFLHNVEVMREVAASHDHVHFFDSSELSIDPRRFLDGCHLDRAGLAQKAAAFREFLVGEELLH